MSKAFGDVTSQDTLRFGRIGTSPVQILRYTQLTRAYSACAMHERKYDVVVDQCRKFILTYQMYSEPFHVLNACLASGFHQANAFQDSKLQKQLSRETRLMNLVVTGDESSYNVTPQGRFHIKTSEASKKAREEDGDEDGARSGVQVNKPEKETPVPWTVLSQTFLNARSWQSAICTFLIAFSDRGQTLNVLQFTLCMHTRSSPATRWSAYLWASPASDEPCNGKLIIATI